MNDLAIFGSAPVPAFSQAVLDHAKHFAGSAPQMPRISTKGSRFGFIRGGALEFTAPTLTIDVVVIDARKTTSRIWYAREYDPNTQEKVKPTCWSPDDRIPTAPLAQRPHVQGPAGPRPVTSCAECPMNVKGSSRNGQGKACTYKQTLVVAPPTNVDEIWRLDVSGMGAFGDSQPELNLRSWKDYRDWLGTPRSNMPHGVPINAIVTTLSFDARQSVPALRFGIGLSQGGQAAWLDPETAERAVRRAQQEDVVAMLETVDDEDGAPMAVAAPATAVSAPAAPQAPSGPSSPTAPATAFAAAAPAAAPVAPPPPPPVAAPPAAPLGLGHHDVPQDVRDWAAHPSVTDDMVQAYLSENYPEALVVSPPAPAAPPVANAPATPPTPRKRRTKAEMEADAATKAAQTAAAAPAAAATPAAAPVSGFAGAAAPAASGFAAAAPAAPVAPAAPAAVGGTLASKLGSLLGNFDDAG